MSECKLDRYIPDVMLEIDDTVKFKEIIEYTCNVIKTDIENFTNIRNIDKAEEKYLDLLLYEVGWNLDIELTENYKRKILKLAIQIYKGKGIRKEIENVISLLIGKTCNITDVGSGNVWRLGISRLGGNTILGHAGSEWEIEVHFSESLTSYEESIVRKILDYMLPGWVSYKIVID